MDTYFEVLHCLLTISVGLQGIFQPVCQSRAAIAFIRIFPLERFYFPSYCSLNPTSSPFNNRKVYELFSPCSLPLEDNSFLRSTCNGIQGCFFFIFLRVLIVHTAFAGCFEACHVGSRTHSWFNVRRHAPACALIGKVNSERR